MDSTKDKFLLEEVVIDETIDNNFTEIKLFALEGESESINKAEIIEPLMFNEPLSFEEPENVEIIEEKEIEDSGDKQLEEEPLFRVVIPERRTWFYNVKCFFKGLSFMKKLFGVEIKALPAPDNYKYN